MSDVDVHHPTGSAEQGLIMTREIVLRYANVGLMFLFLNKSTPSYTPHIFVRCTTLHVAITTYVIFKKVFRLEKRSCIES